MLQHQDLFGAPSGEREERKQRLFGLNIPYGDYVCNTNDNDAHILNALKQDHMHDLPPRIVTRAEIEVQGPQQGDRRCSEQHVGADVLKNQNKTES
jgi:hypothetical protein